MVFKKSFTLLMVTGTTPFFVVVSIISENHCSFITCVSVLCENITPVSCINGGSFLMSFHISFRREKVTKFSSSDEENFKIVLFYNNFSCRSKVLGSTRPKSDLLRICSVWDPTSSRK